MKEILCFGDSNTYGLIPGTQNRYDRDIRWTGILEKHLYKKGYRIIEEGLCGRTTIFDDLYREGRNGSSMLPTLLESHKPIDQVILMLGTNDCKSCFHTNPQKIGAGIECLIKQIKSVDAQIEILLISPILLGDEVWKPEFDPEFDQTSVEVSKGLKEVYQEIARKYQCDFLAASDVAEASRKDREHLNRENHLKLAKAILNCIEKSKFSYDFGEAIA